MKNIFVLMFLLSSLGVSAQVPMQDDDSGKWGLATAAGSWITEPIFEKVLTPNKQFVIVKFSGRWGSIDPKGNVLVWPMFMFDHHASLAMHSLIGGTPVGRELWAAQDIYTKLWGFVNTRGNWAVEPIYQHVYKFGENRTAAYAAVCVKGRWGCIDRKGNEIVKPLFSNSSPAESAADEITGAPGYASIPASQVRSITPKQFARNDENVSQTTTAQTTQSQSSGSVQKTTAATSGAVDGTTAAQSNMTPPTLTILSPINGSDYSRDEVVITYNAKTSNGETPDIIVSVNGEPYDMKAKGIKRAFNELIINVPRTQERCRIQLIARDSRGLNSEPAYLNLTYIGERMKPTLYMLCVGVGQYDDPNITDLEHAAKDARDIAAVISGMQSTVYQKIEPPVVLTDGEAGVVKIKSAIMQLAKKAKEGDVVFLYFSGHGDIENAEGYFLSSDAIAGDLYSTAVNFNDIKLATRILVENRCKVVAFMDACHAGAMFDTKSVSESLQFAEPGAITYCSSTRSQKSNEAAKWQNGIFTKALIEGFQGKAKDNNGQITTLELGNYIKSTVSAETNRTQSPIIDNRIGEFTLF